VRVREYGGKTIEAAGRISSELFLSLHHKMAGDRVVRLADVLELAESAEPVTASSNYPQVGVRGFGGGLFPKPAISGSGTSYKAFNRLYAGAIVLSQVKGWEGAIARCPTELDGWFVSPEYRTFRCKPDLASDEYFGELVRMEWFWSKLQEATRGVGARRERTRPEQFLKIELPLPVLEDQLRILEVVKRQLRLKAKHAAVREANAALLPATLERLFAEKP
jgi:type I restriction enzyme S subunit